MSSLSAKAFAALGATAEVCGTQLSEAAALLMAEDLSAYPEQILLAALARCRREIKGRLTLADIVERIEMADGRPGSDEAWAQVGTRDDGRTIVATEEAMEAWAEVRHLLENDEMGARMAFREAYRRIVTRNRESGIAVRWIPSLGYDLAGRETALREAVDRGKLTPADVAGLLPASAFEARALPPRSEESMLEEGRQALAVILRGLSNGPRPKEESINWEAEGRRLAGEAS